ncbi:MAG: deoxyguanosinetriphosphate triphosphohydrolase [Myxococcota bacterium]
MRVRSELERAEEESLAAWGMRSSRSRGRLYPTDEPPYRTAFQRDRDRVIHSRAFRRLQYKTQVFIHHEGDHYRNRLTHTLEVAQIARTVARALGANEDLTEAIVLAHDMGHTPFGHAGERALHALARGCGGFEHNRQSLRLVDWLERRSSRHRGLNLTAETRAGILKHGVKFPRQEHPVPLPDLARSPSVEAQIADACDSIAYHNHDIDDGLRSGLLDWGELSEVPLFREALDQARKLGEREPRGLRAHGISRLIHRLATDLIRASVERLQAARVESPEAVRELGEIVVCLSPEVAQRARELGAFLREKLYFHYRVVRMAAKAEGILRDLWEAYSGDPRLLPPTVLECNGGEPRERAIADYLAGMTDRFAMDEHQRLFDPHTPT